MGFMFGACEPSVHTPSWFRFGGGVGLVGRCEAGAGGRGFGGAEGAGALEALLKAAGVSEVLWVDHRCDLGVGIDYPKPEQIGADRLANAAAAAYWIGLPAVVCDFGTALTFDVVAQKRGYGGVIVGLPDV